MRWWSLGMLALVACGRTTVLDALPPSIPTAQIDPAELTVTLPATVVLDGSGSGDPLRKKLGFSWKLASRPAGAAAQLDSPSLSLGRFTPDVPGLWVAELVVSNGEQTSVAALSKVTVLPAIKGPVANAGPDRKGVPGDTIVLDGTGSFDPEGNPLSYAWQLTARPAGSSAMLSTTLGAAPLLVADVPGTYSATLTVAAGGLSATDSVAVTIRNVNHAPIAVAGPAQTLLPGTFVTLDGSKSTDPDGDQIFFLWKVTSTPPGGPVTLIPSNQAQTSFTPTEPGDYIFYLEVKDDLGAVNLDVTTVTVRAALPDGGPLNRDGGTKPDAGSRDAGGGDVFDPGEVYLVGTVSEALCGHDAIAHWSTPNVGSTGFECYFDEHSAALRPDGRLLYKNSFEDNLREYHCDACAFNGAGTYPSMVLVNDPQVAAACTGANLLPQFKVSPEGAVLHRCNGTPTLWRDSAGATIFTAGATEDVVALGASGWLLTSKQVVNTQAGTAVPLLTVPTGVAFFGARWNPPDGFLVALNNAGTAQLWRVNTSGAGTLVGLYPALPPNVAQFFTSAAMDRGGRLFGMTTIQGQFVDVIVRQEVGGTSDVVYSEATNPVVKIHVSTLITGP
jgi:hypothetical protein